MSALSTLVPGLVAAGFCFLLPDLIDKPLWVLGVIPDGRYMGHTLFLVGLVAAAFALVRWPLGLVALFVGITHLASDRDLHSDNPWLYPFKQYVFTPNDYRTIITWENVRDALAQALVLAGAVFVVLAVYQGLSLLARRLLSPKPDGGAAPADAPGDCPEPLPGPAHGGPLCWLARVAGILLSLGAVIYLLVTRPDYGSSWMVIPAAAAVSALSLAPSLAACRWHRAGGAFLLIVCVAYTELAHEVLDRDTFFHFVLPFVAAWAATGIMHLGLSWKEGHPEGGKGDHTGTELLLP